MSALLDAIEAPGAASGAGPGAGPGRRKRSQQGKREVRERLPMKKAPSASIEHSLTEKIDWFF